jgi:predicted sulfurtransferase
MGTILLFYKYVQLDNPAAIMDWQREVCQELGLKGRIILAHEGINGTVGGSMESTQKYREIMQKNPLFADIDFKEAPGSAECFPKLRIVVKDEIVFLGKDTNAINARNGGQHLKPAHAHAMMNNASPDLVIFDARNNFESRVGTFKNAITPDINHFRDLPSYIDNNMEQFKDKEVIMFCTGGIRCERASAYLNSKNVAKKVYQIEGGIHRYIEQFPEGHFRGKNYVFDGRVTVKVNDDILGTCNLCAIPYDEYTHCLIAHCNKQMICCPPCLATYKNTCGTACLDLLQSNNVGLRPAFKKQSC